MPTELDHGIVVPSSGTEPPDIYGIATRLGNSVEEAFEEYVDPTAWTAPTFTNSWVNFGSTLQVAQYRKRNDVVELRGAIKLGTIGTGAFTLPVGFRPPADIAFAVDSQGAYGRVDVTSAGVVTPSFGNNASVRLDGIAFSVTA
jgi:hypothetical protein